MPQHPAQHDGRFDIKQASHLARVVGAPEQRGQRPHVMRRMDDRLATAETKLSDQGTPLLGKSAGVVALRAVRPIAIAVATHVGDQHG